MKLSARNIAGVSLGPAGHALRACAVIAALAAATLLATGCGNMKKQRNVRTFDPPNRSDRGTSARLPPAHTVARGTARSFSAMPRSELASIERIPFPTTAALLARGQDRFNVYCAVCHGPDGYGRGIVVRRGFPAPPSLHEDRLRAAPVGHFFAVITDGYGQMYSYADRLDENDRWAVIAYIRALQRSQHTTVADVPPAQQRTLAHE
ncbi:MAG TPA: cytochrome c [Opitutaceae bacterium]|nr:cytochrome c [Opitutaceae bacterium]